MLLWLESVIKENKSHPSLSIKSLDKTKAALDKRKMTSNSVCIEPVLHRAFVPCHLVIVCCSAIQLPAEFRQHQRLLEQLLADIHMAVDPAASKVQPLLICSLRQPAVRPAVYCGKVNVRGGVVACKVTALAHGVIWVVWKQICRGDTL